MGSAGTDTSLGHPTILEVAGSHAGARPDRLAYLFLENGETEADRYTFHAFEQAARNVAVGLLERAEPGDRALLVYETGLDFLVAFFGCLFAGVIAVPAPAPEGARRQRGLPRLEAIVHDCSPKLLLCNAHSRALLGGLGPQESSLGALQWLETPPLAEREGSEALPGRDPDDIAFLQYTSGSTTTPRGVMVSHANIVGHLAMIREACGYDDDSVSVTWMPHFHDYGLIQGMLVPFFNGTPAVIMSPFDFVKKPITLLRAISRYGGTHTEGPSFAYAHCVKRARPKEGEELDLSSWRSIGNAAEPVHPGTLDDFTNVFAEWGLPATTMSPAFGLAEVTLLATTTRPEEQARWGAFDSDALSRHEAIAAPSDASSPRRVSACGTPLPRTRVAIVDPETRDRLPDGRVGEIWVSSATIPSGYWGRPEESESTFRARIVGEDDATWLRTGDLGFLHEEQLYVTSRLKDLIIIRGLNHHPQDIEWSVHDAHPGLRPGNVAAFSVDSGDEERLVLVSELRSGAFTQADLDAIPEAMADAVAASHDIPLEAVALIPAGTMLKTSSGKVQRRACKAALLDGSLQTLHVWSPLGAKGVVQQARGDVQPPEPREVEASGGRDPEAASPTQEDRSRQRADELIPWLREYAERRINSRLIDERRCVPPHVVMDLGNRGVFGLQVPEELGGLGLSHSDAYRVIEQLGAIDITLATMIFLHNTNGILPILGYAPAELRAELLPRLAGGRELAAFTLSEPAAGSNLGGLGTRAVQEGPDAWRLNGIKRWNATGWAGVVSVFARLEQPGGRLGPLSAFVVLPDDAGVRMGPEALTMGIRGIIQNGMHLDDVRVGRDRLLGEVGRGMEIVSTVLTEGRLSLSAMALGGVRRCLQLALRFARRRDIETGKLLDNPQTTARMSAVVHRLALERELLTRCAALRDEGREVPPEVGMMLKVLTTDTLMEAADLHMQLLGARGYMENNLAPQLFRDARMLTIGEGANESLLPAVGRAARFKDVIADFLRTLHPGEELPTRLEEVGERLAAAPRLADETDASGRAWADAQLGHVCCAALELAAARAMGARGEGQAAAERWASHRFEEVVRSAVEGSPERVAALSGPALQSEIAAFESVIGDLEPLAPDVDYELDPLCRREDEGPEDEGPEAERAPRPATIEEKRELVRRALTGKQRLGE